MDPMQNADISPMQMLERMFHAELRFMTSKPKDIAILAEAFHPDVVIHEPRSVPYPGDWKGLNGVAALMKRMNDVFSNMSIEGLECSGSSERLHVACKLTVTSRKTGISITQPFAEMLKFEEGLLMEGTPFYFDTAEIQSIL